MHPGIAPVYSLGKFDDGRLLEAIRSHHRLVHKTVGHDHEADTAWDLKQLLRRFIDVCNAIAYAHSRGVIHRDIKPANVLFGKFGETFLIDWGLAKVAGEDELTNVGPLFDDETEQRQETMAGVPIGTPHYMSPEQACGDTENIGPLADVFGLGAMLYEILTGKPPHQGKTRDETIRLAEAGKITPPRSRVPSVPVALEAICMKGLSPSPQERYASATDLAADVRRWLDDEPDSATHFR